MMEREQDVKKVLEYTLFLNLLVSFLKLSYGFYTNSVSILSDGFHSLFDGISNVFGMLGIYISSHPADKEHPYGHRKYETIFALFISLLIFITCVGVIRGSYRALTGKAETIVNKESFILMVITMLINGFVTTYEKKKGKELRSEYLIADALHTKSDIYVSAGVIASLILFKLGILFADALGGLVIGVLVGRTGIIIIKETFGILVDRGQVPEDMVKKIVCGVKGVMDCHEIRTRGTKDHIFLDLHVLVNPDLSVFEAHEIADHVESNIKRRIPDVKDVVVHIEPVEKKDHYG